MLAKQVSGRAEAQHCPIEMLDLSLHLFQGRGVTFTLEGHLFQNLICEVMEPEHIIIRVILAPAVVVLLPHSPVDLKLVVTFTCK